jgi:hypothetical protein
MASSSSPTVQRKRLAAELRRLRGNLKGIEVSKGVGWSTTKVSRAESGKESLPPVEIEKLIDFYGAVDPLRSSLLSLAEDASQRGWWEDFADDLTPEYMEFIGLEAGASSCRTWQSDVVPGLLQVEAYSRELDAAYQRVNPGTPPTSHERFLQVRHIRQQRLTREPVLRASFVVDESVLLRGIGDDTVMRAQLTHLTHVSTLPNVELRILPLRNNQALGGANSFTIISFDSADSVPGGALGDVVNTEALTAQLDVESDANTHLFYLFFDAIWNAALSADDSRDIIVTTKERVWP